MKISNIKFARYEKILYNFYKNVKTNNLLSIRQYEKLISEFIESGEYTEIEKDVNKFKGDMFEFFGEVFVSVFSADSRGFGLYEYTSIAESEDRGVDGIGYNVNGFKTAVQFKYRSDKDNIISETDLTKTYTSAKLQFKCDVEKPRTILLITNSKGVHYKTVAAFGDKLLVVDRVTLSALVDRNKTFWNICYDLFCGEG